MPFKVLVGLILCNVIWAANPIMGKILLGSFEPAQAAWLRYASATVFFLISIGFVAHSKRMTRKVQSGFFARPRTSKEALLLIGVGFSAFCFAPLVGLTGLNKTGAIDNALLIAMEPMVTVSLAIAFLGERLSRLQLGSFVLAILGFGLLSGLIFLPPSQWIREPSIQGNLIIVLSLFGEASYSIFARRLTGRFPSIEIFGSGLIAGFLILSGAVLFLGSMPSGMDFGALSWKSWVAIFWLGPLGSTLTYLYWLIALESAAVSSAALTLFVQPIVGAILGFLVRGESMTLSRWAGGVVILMAVGLLTLCPRNNSEGKAH